MRSLIALLVFYTLASHAQADVVVVSAERLLDVATGRYLPRPQLVITDGRVTAVGKQGDAMPTGARRVDLPGLTLLPGLIDMHVHLTGDPRYSGYRGLEFTDCVFRRT